jgi:hypothetical protein
VETLRDAVERIGLDLSMGKVIALPRYAWRLGARGGPQRGVDDTP